MRGRLLVLSLLVACASIDPLEPDPLVAPLVDPGSAEELGMVAFLNDASTTFTLLDDDVALDRRAARNLIDAREVALFTNIDEVDAVSYVGVSALQKILDWAQSNGWVEAGSVDRDSAMLALVNDAATDFTLLDIDVALDRRAAQNIIDARAGVDGALNTSDDVTFVSVAQLDAIAYVGPAALELIATYALANGYTGAPPAAAPPCALISEVIEGPGNNNKAVEIYNCGAEPLQLEQIGICLVRNDDTTCSRTSTVGTGSLAAGAVQVTCRTRTGTIADPYQPLVDACQWEIGSAAIFNGDDRLMLFHDADANGALDGDEVVLDTFGDPATRPSDTVWAELGFRRCDLTPFVGGAFDVDALFTRHGSTTFTDLGVAPTHTCGETTLASEGDECLATEFCAEGLRCFGIPRDGSSPYGRCIDTTPIAGEGNVCDRFTPCNDGLICAGWTIWAEGTCVPQWMAGRWTAEGPFSIADAPSGGVSPWVVVQGLASVPVDIEVTAHIEHPRLSDLRVTLMDPNGDTSVLWDQSSELTTWSRSFALSISRDDEVNGRWSLRVQDMVTGETGTIEEWTLFVVSRWD